MANINLDTLTTFTDVDILTDSGLLKNSTLTIENNKIHSIGERHGTEISYAGHLILPGMINAHTHSPMTFLRDVCHGQKNMIENIFFKTESQLNAELTRDLSYSYILSGIKSGVTSFVEHYYFIDGIAEAFENVGVRGFVGETLADLGGAFPSDTCLDDFMKLVKNWSYSERMKPVLCPHAADTVSPELAQRISKVAAAEKLPMHFHLAQRESEFKDLQIKYNKSPVQLAHEWGWLTENSLAVHLLHVDDQDIKTLKESGACVVSCPSSQILYEFLAPLEKFYQAGIPLSLGTDCAASNDQADILSELKVLALMMKNKGVHDDQLYRKSFESVTINPAKTLNSNIGVIKQGALADLVFVEQSLDTLPLRDIWTHIIFSYSSQHVNHVMVDGQFILHSKKLCLADEENLTKTFSNSLKKIKLS